MIEKEMEEAQVLLLVIPKAGYMNKIQEIIKDMGAKFKNVCYLSLNRPYKSLVETIKRNSLDPANFFFIDTLTSGIGTHEEVPNCIFVSAPNALTELSVAFSRALNEKKCEGTLVDSLSTLLVYEQVHSIIQFTHNTITKVRMTNSKLVLISLKEDTSSELIKDLYMFVDKVVESN